jgi:hypothetical protein
MPAKPNRAPSLVQSWNLAEGTSRQVEHDLQGDAQAAFCEVGSRFLVTGSRDSTQRLRVYDESAEPAGPWITGYQCSPGPDGRWALVSPDIDKPPRVWNTLSGEAVRLEPLADNAGQVPPARNNAPQGQHLGAQRLFAVDENWANLHGWDLASGARLWSVPVPPEFGERWRTQFRRCVIVSPDEKRVAVDLSNIVWLLDGATGKRIAEIRVPRLLARDSGRERQCGLSLRPLVARRAKQPGQAL